jgi:hypothetical protein
MMSQERVADLACASAGIWFPDDGERSKIHSLLQRLINAQTVRGSDVIPLMHGDSSETVDSVFRQDAALEHRPSVNSPKPVVRPARPLLPIVAS